MPAGGVAAIICGPVAGIICGSDGRATTLGSGRVGEMFGWLGGRASITSGAIVSGDANDGCIGGYDFAFQSSGDGGGASS